MQFRVPKFLDREATIAFGLTFKKLAFVGAAGLVLFILYYILPKIIFYLLGFLVTGIVAAFLFIKIGGQSLMEVLYKFFGFFFTKKTYFWQKKQGVKPISLIKKKKSEKKQAPVLKLAPRSRLHDIKAHIDLGP